jgi:hypothetical protein
MVDNFFTPNGMLDSLPPLLKEVGNVLEEVKLVISCAKFVFFFGRSMTNGGSQHTHDII